MRKAVGSAFNGAVVGADWRNLWNSIRNGSGTGGDSEPKEDLETAGGNYNKVKDNYLKQNGIDTHELKRDMLGRKAPIAQYDIYVNKDTGELFIFGKGGKGVGIPTGEFIK